MNIALTGSLNRFQKAGVRTSGRPDVRTPDVRTSGRLDVRTPARPHVQTPGRPDVRTSGRASHFAPHWLFRTRGVWGGGASPGIKRPSKNYYGRTNSKTLNGSKIARIAPILTIFGRNRSRRPGLIFQFFLRQRKQIRVDEKISRQTDERTTTTTTNERTNGILKCI